MKLGRFRQGQDALSKCVGKGRNDSLPNEPRASPDESVLLCKAGTLALKGNLHDQAVQYFQQALALNPFLWEAVEGLCRLGKCPEIDLLIRPQTAVTQLFAAPPPPGHIRFDTKSTQVPTFVPPPQTSGGGFFTPAPNHGSNGKGPQFNPLYTSGSNGPLQPFRLDAGFANGRDSIPQEGKAHLLSSGEVPGYLEELAPPRDKRRTRTRSRSQDPDDMDEDMQPVESTSSTSSPREFSPGPSAGGTLSQQPLPSPQDELHQAANVILELTRKFAKIVRALSMFEPQGALDAIMQLPAEQTKAPWIYALMGRARFEMADYLIASRAFEQARALDPYRMWDMDVFSTVLWHLQRDVQLSFLAQELTSIDEHSPQAWIATGNCFSLQKDHSQALTCFKRATQLDPRSAVGYALSGHEALALDDHDSAMQFFRAALRTDSRHYPAWYGLGTVYLKQNKLRKAEYHFRKAIEISPSNAVLIHCEGTALEKRGELEQALERYNRSLALSPLSPLVKFKRVKVLIQLKQYENALKDLLELRDLAPEEANVPFVLGKLYREMGRNVEATRCFTIARDLDPKLSAIIGHLLDE
ncbi:anaphase-promoting complex subunit cdc27 [Tulasnella sp. 408]|nr:anaphase-promoting complex subunit cdc27 [Tulasnella sp. 408]